MKTKTPIDGAMASESPGQKPAVPKKPSLTKLSSGRPRGQAPKGKRWNADLQAYEVDPDAPPPFPKGAGAKTGRPRGKAPRGQRWNADAQAYEADPDFAPPPKRENSKYVGVYPWSFEKAVSSKGKYAGEDKWRMKITLEKAIGRIFEGPFGTEEEAARAYDAKAGPAGRPVNFPNASAVPGQAQALKGAKSSAYRGVCWHKASKMWTPMIKVDKKNTTLGYFKAEADAARKYDAAARPLGRPVNFSGVGGDAAVHLPPPTTTTTATATTAAHAAVQATAAVAGLADETAVGLATAPAAVLSSRPAATAPPAPTAPTAAPPARMPVAPVVAVPAAPAACRRGTLAAPVAI